MRYWLQKGRRSAGPYTASQLEKLEGFGPDCLVCPETYAGDGAAHWRPARTVRDLRGGFSPEFFLALPGGQRLPGRLPPDPTLGDAAEARGLAARVKGLERLLLKAAGELKARDRDLEALRSRVSDKDRTVHELRRSLSAFGTRLDSVAAMHRELKMTADRIDAQKEAVARVENGVKGMEEELRTRVRQAEDAAAAAVEAARLAVERAKKEAADALAVSESALAAFEAATRETETVVAENVKAVRTAEEAVSKLDALREKTQAPEKGRRRGRRRTRPKRPSATTKPADWDLPDADFKIPEF